MGDHVKNQHYVTRLLLKKFASKGDKFIWAYDRKSQYQKIKERPIKKVASQDFFYDQIKKSKKGSFEYPFQNVENDASLIIEKILREKNLRVLDNKERDKVALFITSQIFRTKGNLLQSEKLDEEFTNKLNAFFTNPIPKIDSKDLWFFTLSQIPFFKNALLNKVWVLIERKNSFYISDNPVVLQNTTNKNEFIGTLGLDSYGIEIYLPLSPSIVLGLFCEKFFQERGYMEEYIHNFKVENELILNLNYLQAFYSERFVFSNKNDFSLIEEYFRNNAQ